MKNFIVLIAGLLSLSACTHLAATIPTPIVEVPEVSGKDKVIVAADVTAQDGIQYEATGDASFRPPDLSTPKLTHGFSTKFGGSLEALRRLRIGGGLDFVSGGALGLVQYQLIGDGRSEAKEGNFSLSVFGHAGRNAQNKSGDQNGVFGAGGNNWAADIKNDWYDFGASVGYRTGPGTTIYLGAAKQTSFISVNIDQTQGSATPQGRYFLDDKGDSEKGLIGADWAGERGDLFVALDYTHGHYQKAGDVFITSISSGFRIELR